MTLVPAGSGAGTATSSVVPPACSRMPVIGECSPAGWVSSRLVTLGVVDQVERGADGAAERRRPRRRRVAVGRRPPGGGRRAGEAARRGRAADAEQVGEHGVRCPLVEAHGDLRARTSAPAGSSMLAHHRRLRIGAPAVGGPGAQPGEDERHRRVAGRGDGRRRRRSAGGRPRPSGRARCRSRRTRPRPAPGRASGRARRRESIVIVTVLAAVVGSMSTRWPSGRSDRSSSTTALRRAVVDGDRHVADVAHGRGAGRLVQRQVVDRLGDVEADLLADRRGAVGDPPRRRRIAVDGHHRAVLGPVGERLAVGRRPCPHRAVLHGDGRRRRRRRRTRAAARRRGPRAARRARSRSSSSVNPTTSCELRQWWARSRLESVTMIAVAEPAAVRSSSPSSDPV